MDRTEQNMYKLSHIDDLSLRAFQGDYMTHSAFLSESEQAFILSKFNIDKNIQAINGARFILYGGREDAERKMLIFIPSYEDRESFITREQSDSDIISLIRVRPKNKNFSEPLTHRDYLGSLMKLGIEREQIGDILVSKDEAYIYVDTRHADTISIELTRVRHTTVVCSVVALSECHIETEFKELSGSVNSERVDAVIAMVFHLSRNTVKELIERDKVMIDGILTTSTSYLLKEGQKVSVRGYGKFIYEGKGNTTKKGRVYVNVKKYI